MIAKRKLGGVSRGHDFRTLGAREHATVIARSLFCDGCDPLKTFTCRCGARDIARGNAAIRAGSREPSSCASQ